MTIEQDWARERNGLKWSLMGMLSRCKRISSCSSLLPSEKDFILVAKQHLDQMLSGWDKRNGSSKRKYLREVSK